MGSISRRVLASEEARTMEGSMPTKTSYPAARTRTVRVRPADQPSDDGYYWHADQTAAALLELVKTHSVDRRVVDPMITWTPGRALDGLDDGTGLEQHVYEVLGWTNTSILRSALAERLDSLHPVAAFRLLDQPEIACLDRSNRDYIALSHNGAPMIQCGPLPEEVNEPELKHLVRLVFPFDRRDYGLLRALVDFINDNTV